MISSLLISFHLLLYFISFHNIQFCVDYIASNGQWKEVFRKKNLMGLYSETILPVYTKTIYKERKYDIK